MLSVRSEEFTDLSMVDTTNRMLQRSYVDERGHGSD
jgi:hypothetical protein